MGADPSWDGFENVPLKNASIEQIIKELKRRIKVSAEKAMEAEQCKDILRKLGKGS